MNPRYRLAKTVLLQAAREYADLTASVDTWANPAAESVLGAASRLRLAAKTFRAVEIELAAEVAAKEARKAVRGSGA